MKLSWGTGIAAVYTTFALATITMVVFASQQNIDLERTDYYQESLRRNEHASAEHNTRALGNDASIIAIGNRIQITLPSRFSAAQGRVQLYRPTESKLDFFLPLTLDSTGNMIVDMSGRPAGRWDVRIEWSDGTPFRLSKQLYIE